MSKLKAKIRGKVATVPENMSKDRLVKIFNNWYSGMIVVCPNCKKVDINPYYHFDDCKPEEEAYNQLSQEYYE